LPASTALLISASEPLRLRANSQAGDVAAGQQHAGHHQFLHRVGVGAGRVEHRDAQLRQLLDRDVVHARAGAADGLERLRDFHVVHLERAQQDAVRLFHVGRNLELLGRQARQPERRDVVERQYLVHFLIFNKYDFEPPRRQGRQDRQENRFYLENLGVLGALAVYPLFFIKSRM
jgi:hypothetical protein